MIMNKTYIWDRTKIKFKMAAKFNTRSHYSLQIKNDGKLLRVKINTKGF